jgi:hypothetical protein
VSPIPGGPPAGDQKLGIDHPQPGKPQVDCVHEKFVALAWLACNAEATNEQRSSNMARHDLRFHIVITSLKVMFAYKRQGGIEKSKKSPLRQSLESVQSEIKELYRCFVL